MVVDMRKKLRDDRMSKSQSFGSDCFPSSQSRKISIGIPAEKKKPEATEDDEDKIPSVERTNFKEEDSMEAENKGEGASAASEGKQSGATEQVISPWITKQFFYQNAPISDTVLCVKQASGRPATVGKHKKINGVMDAKLAHSVQFFANQTSVLQSGDNNQKKCSGITYVRQEGKNGSQEKVEEFSFATAQEAIVSDKVAVTDKTENITETLRMKIWRILGTVSSPKSQPSNSQAHETGADNLKPEQFADQIGDGLDTPWQNSDTIETDSESPKHHTSKASTKCLTRKRASTKVLQEKSKLGPSSYTKQKHQMNIFSFEEERSGKLDGAINFGSLMSSQKKSQIKSSIIEPRKISFSEKDNADEPHRVSNKCESLRHTEKTPSLGYKEDSFHGCMPKDERDYFETNNTIPDKDFHQPSELKMKNQEGESSASAGARDHQEDCSNPSSKNIAEPSDEFQSLSFAFKNPILSPSPCSTPGTVQIKQDVHSPALEDRRFSVGGICSFRTLQTSETDCSESDEETESPVAFATRRGDAEKLQDCSPRKPSPFKEKEDTEDDLAEFSPEDGDPGSSEDGSPIIKGYDCIGERDWFQEPSERNQEDELARAVTMFAFALQNFRRKMDSATQKESSEILVSVSEGIHLQLQNIETKIQTDLGKLTSLSNSKRKRLETRFEEQQEQLKLIHQKFKTDIHHHIQNCQRTLEVLEAHQIELKGAVKKQRTSHQKLILQVEEAVQTQLNDALSRITTVHESARKKMFQLKHVITECLKEDTVN